MLEMLMVVGRHWRLPSIRPTPGRRSMTNGMIRIGRLVINGTRVLDRGGGLLL
jgi:hypothetical protein